MGRRRWTIRLTVEECYAVEIGNLVRAGAFEAERGVTCSYVWNDGLGNPISSIKFRAFPDNTGAMAIHFYHRVPATLSTPPRIQHQIAQITTTACHFGERATGFCVLSYETVIRANGALEFSTRRLVKNCLGAGNVTI